MRFLARFAQWVGNDVPADFELVGCRTIECDPGRAIVAHGHRLDSHIVNLGLDIGDNSRKSGRYRNFNDDRTPTGRNDDSSATADAAPAGSLLNLLIRLQLVIVGVELSSGRAPRLEARSAGSRWRRGLRRWSKVLFRGGGVPAC